MKWQRVRQGRFPERICAMKIESTKRFHKAYARLSPTQRKAVDKALLAYGENRHHPVLQDHALKGKMQGLRAFSAGWDLRVIYREEGGFITIVLIDTGTHNQVY